MKKINSELLDVSNSYLILDEAQAIYFDSYIDSYSLDEILEKTISEYVYNAGIDNYLLKHNSISAGNYKKLLKEYDYLFMSNKFNDEEAIKRAYDYIIDIFDYYDIYLYKKGETFEISGDNFLDKLSNIIDNSTKKIPGFKNKNKYLVDFIDYYKNKNVEKLLMRNGVR